MSRQGPAIRGGAAATILAGLVAGPELRPPGAQAEPERWVAVVVAADAAAVQRPAAQAGQAARTLPMLEAVAAAAPEGAQVKLLETAAASQASAVAEAVAEVLYLGLAQGGRRGQRALS